MDDIVKLLISRKESISVMESCTGGYISNQITNIEGSSEIFSFGAVTYSNEYKVKLGVSEELIDHYSVYSMEVANDMARAIVNYTNSNYGIGITGKMNKPDPFNPYGDDNKVYLAIYNNNQFYNKTIILEHEKRIDNKKQVFEEVISLLNMIINE